MQRYLMSVATGSLALAFVGCVNETANIQDNDEDVQVSQTQQGVTAIGDPLPGTDPDKFAEAKENFAATEDINDGLGPVFNERACGNCHTTPVVGGSGVQIERRFGEVTNGIFYAYDQAQDNEGGTLRQLFSNGTYVNPATGVTCTIPVEHEPATATVHNVGRRTLPLFGLGLVDALPDFTFDAIAALEPAAQRGTVLRAIPQFPDPRDPNQSFTAKRVARFGIKDQQTNLQSFAGDAYINEMGISTQSCLRGVSVTAFASDNQSNNVAPKAGCNMGDLAPRQPDGSFTDDAVGPCVVNGQAITEVQDDLDNFRFFMEHEAPPPPGSIDAVSAVVGPVVFASTGCANCHIQFALVTPSNPFNGVPGNMSFFPFSDFLVHDMGSLGDGIGNTADTVAKTRQMRTAPLWGARFNTQFLHDGRAKTVRDAILAHDGQGKSARDAFASLDSLSQFFLLQYVNSL